MAGMKIIANSLPADGWDVERNIDVDEDLWEVKGSGGVLAGYDALNMSDTVLYLKFYNGPAHQVTLGVTEPILTKPIPTLGGTDGAGRQEYWLPQGLSAFTEGITVAAVTGKTDSDTTGPSSDNDLMVHVTFK